MQQRRDVVNCFKPFKMESTQEEDTYVRGLVLDPNENQSDFKIRHVMLYRMGKKTQQIRRLLDIQNKKLDYKLNRCYFNCLQRQDKLCSKKCSNSMQKIKNFLESSYDQLKNEFQSCLNVNELKPNSFDMTMQCSKKHIDRLQAHKQYIKREYSYYE